MQLTKALLFTLIGSAFALPTSSEKRQLATIQGAVTSVQQSLQKLDTAVKATNDAAGVAGLQTAATDVQSTLTKAEQDISGAQPLQLQEALGLQQLATDLTTQATTTVDNLISKKQVFDQLGVSSVVAQQLTAQKQASAGLGQAIVSKVPAIGQGIAQQSIDQITAALDKGIQAYGGAAGATTGAAPPAAAAPGSPNKPATPAPPKASTPAAAPAAPAGGLEGLLGGLLGGAGGANGANGAGGLGALLGGLTGGAGAGAAGGAAGAGGAGGLDTLLGGLTGGATGAGATGATKANVVDLAEDAAAEEDEE